MPFPFSAFNWSFCSCCPAHSDISLTTTFDIQSRRYLSLKTNLFVETGWFWQLSVDACNILPIVQPLEENLQLHYDLLHTFCPNSPHNPCSNSPCAHESRKWIENMNRTFRTWTISACIWDLAIVQQPSFNGHFVGSVPTNSSQVYLKVSSSLVNLILYGFEGMHTHIHNKKTEFWHVPMSA